jgi:hypothetical protein
MRNKDKPTDPERSAKDQKGSRVASRRGTGPRTQIGKERSKYNALKHGLFAKVVLLPHEPQSQFDDLLHGLQQDYMPEGMLEMALVEKLATNLWRYRRFLQAETAEVQENIELQEEESSTTPIILEFGRMKYEKYRAEANRRGDIPDIGDPHILEKCLVRLYEVKDGAGKYGLALMDFLAVNLGLIYGARYPGRPDKDLFDYYLECLIASQATPAERAKKGFASEVDCVQKFIAETEKEIRRLEGLRKRPVQNADPRPLTDDEQPEGMELLRWAIPDPGAMDRLLRYEASLERELDRTLMQLERHQRMRESQKTIEVAHQTTSE